MEERTVTVCDKCLRACCWQGYNMCIENKSAGVIEKSVDELKELNLEHPRFWEDTAAHG